MANGTGRQGGGISVDVENLSEVLSRLDDARSKARDVSPAFRVFDTEVRRFLDLQFRTSGTFGQEPWADLAPSTVRKRRRSGANRGGEILPLWDTANLRRSLLNRPLRVFRSDEYRRGTDVPYANIVGGPETERPIFPERSQPFLEIALKDALEEHFEA